MNAFVMLPVLALVALAACAANPKPAEDSSVFSTTYGDGPCFGNRYVTADNRTKYTFEVAALIGSGQQLMGPVGPGRREEFRLPAGAIHARATSTDAMNAGMAGGIQLSYACRA